MTAHICVHKYWRSGLQYVCVLLLLLLSLPPPSRPPTTTTHNTAHLRMVKFCCESIRHIVQFSRFSTVEVTVLYLTHSLCHYLRVIVQSRVSNIFHRDRLLACFVVFFFCGCIGKCRIGPILRLLLYAIQFYFFVCFAHYDAVGFFCSSCFRVCCWWFFWVFLIWSIFAMVLMCEPFIQSAL